MKLAVCVHLAQNHTRVFLYSDEKIYDSDDSWFQAIEASSIACPTPQNNLLSD